MKKLIFSLSIFFLLLSLSLINGCNYEKPVETSSDEGPRILALTPENIYNFKIKEYVKVTPPNNEAPPFFEYRTVAEYGTIDFDPPVVTTSYFTTPAVSRYDEKGNLIETQHYYLERYLFWTCIETTRGALWQMYGLGLNFEEREDLAPETEACGKNLSSGTFSTTHDNFHIPPSTTITVRWGLFINTL